MRFTKIVVIAVISLGLIVFSSAAAQDNNVEWIPATGELFGTELSPDGQTIATYENSAVHNSEVFDEYLPIRLIDAQTGTERSALSDFTDYASDVSFSPDSNTLASYHSNGYINLWNVADGTLLKTIPAIPGNSTLQFMPDGTTLAVLPAGLLPQILLWDTITGDITAILMPRFETFAQLQEQEFNRTGGPERYISIAASPDGATVAAVTWLGNIWLWNIVEEQATLLREAETDLPTFPIRQLQFSDDGKSLAYLDAEAQEIHIRPIKNSEDDLVIPAEEAVAFAVSPDDQTIAWTDGQHLFVVDSAVPDASTTVQVDESDGRVRQPFAYLAFTPDGQQVVLSGFDAIGSGDNQIAIITLPE